MASRTVTFFLKRTIKQVDCVNRDKKESPSYQKENKNLLIIFELMAPAGQSHLDVSFALLCGLGGITGYMKAKSLPSLIGGLGFGAAYAGTAYCINVRTGSSESGQVVIVAMPCHAM